MSEKIKFIIDDKVCTATPGQTIMQAARDNGIYIPSLCYLEGIKPAGSCRVCNVKVHHRYMTACTTPVAEGMVIENNDPELEEVRKAIVEIFFASGNHFCPACEKSGNCELQALAYRFRMMVPRYSYEFPRKDVDAGDNLIYHDRNRCILCKRCIRFVMKQGKHVFAFNGKGGEHLYVEMDHELAEKMTEEEALKAMEICPVGAILKKGKGYDVPIGQRKFDHKPIGHEFDK